MKAPLTLESPCEPSSFLTRWKGTRSYHTLLSFCYPNHDLDKLILAYFRLVAVPCLNMGIPDLKDTRCKPNKPSMTPKFLMLKLSHVLVLTGWWAISNRNLVLNCAGSSRHFLRQKLQDEKCIPLSESAKYSCAACLVLEVRNWKGRCCTWSIIATTSRALALRLVLLQDLMDISLSFLFQIPAWLSEVALAYRSPSTKCTPCFTYIIEPYCCGFMSAFLYPT
jgi:hypothetical protein